MPKYGTWNVAEIVVAFASGEPLKALSKRVGGGINQIRRALKNELGEEHFQEIVLTKKAKASEARKKPKPVKARIRKLRPESKPEHTESVLQIFSQLRQNGFPVIQAHEAKLKEDAARLQTLTVYVDDQLVVRPYNTVGTDACASFFPQRYRAKHSGNKKSAWEAWHNDDDLKKAIKFQIDCGDPTSPARVLRALVMFRRTPSVFRPAVAKYVYKTYANQGTVWDPCAGYGSRLLAAMVSGVERYIGTDIEPATVSGNLAIAGCLQASDHCSVVCGRAEKFDPQIPLDLVFTSPPYFNLERYTTLEDGLYESPKDWVNGFLRPVLTTAYLRLKRGGHLVLNLPSKPVKGLRLDLEAAHTAEAAGFSARETFWLPVRNFNGTMKTEPILAWQKP